VGGSIVVSFCLCRSKAKSPPQDVLLSIQQENKFKEEAEESSLFSFKIGLYKLGCSLLMNGLVHEASEVKFIVYPVGS
jgi:UDP-glucose:glycoprotein glucosyltransferase